MYALSKNAATMYVLKFENKFYNKERAYETY